ncbi:cysteine desulfurase [Candidatus Gracilibacteria bacterium]|nr:cysteine desulfurase [Candidatus Gracilibacteria bacterium]
MAKDQIFLDYASATPVDPQVLAVMMPYFGDRFFNPSSLYAAARDVKADLHLARLVVADLIQAHVDEIVFVSSGTEADNLALRGICQSAQRGKHLIVSAIEHQAILATAQDLERQGWSVTYLPVNDQGIVELSTLKQALRPDTVLVSIMLANNEIGTIQPLREIAKLVHAHGALVHTDATQALSMLPVSIRQLGVDLMTITSAKIYGPKGAAALYVRRGIKLHSALTGGFQEGGLRAGTENMPAIVGFAEACRLLMVGREQQMMRIEMLRDQLLAGVLEIPHTKLNGSAANRLVNNLNVTFEGFEGDMLLMFLDELGIQVSSGSACTAMSVSPSHVLVALGRSAVEAKSSVRFTLGWPTTAEEIEYVLSKLPDLVAKLRSRF